MTEYLGYQIRYTEGARLGDIHAVGSDEAIDCVQVVGWDWTNGEAFGTPDPEGALREWVDEMLTW